MSPSLKDVFFFLVPLIFSLVTYPLSPSEVNISKFEIPIFVDEEIYNIKVRYLGNELVETHWGLVDCMLFQPYMQRGRIFEKEEEMKIWITDDENRILVKAETAIWAGIIRAELNNYNNLKRPLVFIK